MPQGILWGIIQEIPPWDRRPKDPPRNPLGKTPGDLPGELQGISAELLWGIGGHSLDDPLGDSLGVSPGRTPPR